MRRSLVACAAAAAASSAAAQAVTAQVAASHDTDDFDQVHVHVGASLANGLGLRAGHLRYEAPGWQASGESLAATWRHRGDALQVDAAAGVARLAGRHRGLLELDALQTLSASTKLGLAVERGIVDSVRAIDDGISYTAALAVVDHAFTPRFNVGAAGGALWFSDGNRRPQLRTRWNYELAADWGLNAYVKTRHLSHTDPYSPAYYSPDRLGEVSAGLSARVAVAPWAVLSVGADAGRQRTEAAREGIWSAAVTLSSRRGAAVEWRAALQASNTASQFASGSDYRYTSLRVDVRVPF